MIRPIGRSGAALATLALVLVLPAVARPDALPASRARLDQLLRLDSAALHAPAPSAFATGVATTDRLSPFVDAPGVYAKLERHVARVQSLKTTMLPPSTPAKVAPPRVDGIFYASRLLDAASAGDVDNNGTTDWILGESGFSTPLLTGVGRIVINRRTFGGNGVTTFEIVGPTAFASFGASVSSAGDINADGYDDIIVGAPGFDGTRGRAFVYRGGPGGIGASPPAVIEGTVTMDFLGFSVAGAGDVNGDGYDDVIVGSPGGSTGAEFNDGRAAVYLGGAAGISLTPAWTIDGSGSNAALGWCVTGFGDVNADGYSDVMVTSPQYTNGEFSEGRAELFLGGPGGLSPVSSFDWESNQVNWGQDMQVCLPGDFNGDGFGDMVIGMPNADSPGTTNDGRIIAFAGASFPFFSPEVFTEYGGVDNMHFGAEVVPAGDLNGDGFADYLATAPDLVGLANGAWAINYGSSDYGLVETYQLGIGDDPGIQYGLAAAGIGDNGDGHPSYVVGGPVIIVAPGEVGDAAPSPPGAVLGAGFAVSAFEGYTLNEFQYLQERPFAQGNSFDTRFGNALALADVNGDGFSDVIVGANQYSEQLNQRGKVNVYHGKPRPLTTPPFAVTPKGPALDGGIVFQIPDWTYNGPLEDDNFGVSVANAGDVNGDGYDDVLVGALTHSNPEFSEGAAFLFLGGADGLGLQPEWITEGNEPAYYGYAVGSAGDVNQDGYDDILVGAPLATANAVDQAGKVYLYYGSAQGPSHTPARIFLGAHASSNLGTGCVGIGDVDGDGYPEIAMTEAGYTDGQTREGRVLAYRGGPAGVGSLPFLDWQTNVADAELFRIAPACDVNGDGYADLLASAATYSNGEAGEGAVFLFAGSPAGLGNAPIQTLESNEPAARFGFGLWNAGDLDGDGYGDVIVGAPNYPAPPPAPGTVEGVAQAGRAELYFGSPTGFESIPRIIYDHNIIFPNELGYAVTGGGDVNGDGWPDIVFSAPSASASKLAQNGVVYVGFDNVLTDGLARPRLTLKTDGVTPIATGLRSDSPTSFRVSALARTPVGRGKVRLQWQGKTPAQPFDGSGIGSSALLRTGVPSTGFDGSSIALGGTVGGFVAGNRVRLRTRLATRHPYFHRSRWFTDHSNGRLETDLRTFGPTGFTDVGDPELPRSLSFAGAAPNPFVSGEGGVLRFALPRAGRVTIEAWDAAGRKVADVFDGTRDAGPQGVTWNGRDNAGHTLPRGLYFLRLSANGESAVAKTVIAR